MMYGYKERRTLGAHAIRQLCIKNNWYTMGDNKEYAELLRMADRENITTDDIVEITTDIIEHSELSMEDFESIAFLVVNEATVFIEKEE